MKYTPQNRTGRQADRQAGGGRRADRSQYDHCSMMDRLCACSERASEREREIQTDRRGGGGGVALAFHSSSAYKPTRLNIINSFCQKKRERETHSIKSRGERERGRERERGPDDGDDETDTDHRCSYGSDADLVSRRPIIHESRRIALTILVSVRQFKPMQHSARPYTTDGAAQTVFVACSNSTVG